MSEEYPECDRWSKVHAKAMMLNEFLEFLGSKKPRFALCEYWFTNSDSGKWMSIGGNDIEHLIFEFFDIDIKKLEVERRLMLERLQREADKK